MEDLIESLEKKIDKEQESLKIDNFRPLSNNSKGRNRLIKKSFSIVDKKKTPIKKSVSSIFPKLQIKNGSVDNKNDNNEFNSTSKSNSIINLTSLFNKDIKLTTLNENNISILPKNNIDDINIKNYKYQTLEENNRYPLMNNINSQQRILSKNFANIIKSNDFTPNLGKYDKKIIITLNQKCKELENKYIKALKYYYQMENIYINEEKKKKDSELKLNNSILETNLLKNKYDRKKQDNIHLNNALVNARNEIDRLNIVIKNEQKEMLEKQEEYNMQLKIEENKRTKLRNVIKINERQISILQEKINDSSLSSTMKMKKYLKMKNYMNNMNEEDDNEKQKDEEIIRLKSLIEDLQNQVNNLQNNLKRDKENKKELMGTIKFKSRQHKFNNDNINLLFKTIEQQEQDGMMNYNLLKSKNLIIKDLKERISGKYNIPHYSLPKNIRINSAQKIEQKVSI